MRLFFKLEGAFWLLTLFFMIQPLSCSRPQPDSKPARTAEYPSSSQLPSIQSQAIWVKIPGVVDGLTTFALYWKRPQPHSRTVILLWGRWNESVADLYAHAGTHPFVQGLIASGYSVLALDPRGSRGHGDFYQALADIGTDEVSDVISAALWLESETGPGSLFLVGKSHGGSLALRAAEEFADYPIAVDGVVAFAPITDYEAWKEYVCFNNIFYRCSFLRQYRAEQLYQGSPVHFVPKQRWPLSLLIPDRLCPVLLFHGTKDSMVLLSQSRAWLKADPDATLVELPVDHSGIITESTLQSALQWMDQIAAKGSLLKLLGIRR